MMKHVNVAELKNKLSEYLDAVEGGEEIVVKNRNKPVARIIRIKPTLISEEEQQMVGNGELRLPDREMSRQFLDHFLSMKLPGVPSGSSVEAVLRDRAHD